MKKKVLLKDLVSTGTHIRKEVTPRVLLSDGQYPKGELWDANTILSVIAGVISGQHILEPDSVTTRHIQNSTIKLEDLSTEVTDQLQAPRVDEDDENVIWGGV